jgi:hypothetical protein
VPAEQAMALVVQAALVDYHLYIVVLQIFLLPLAAQVVLV